MTKATLPAIPGCIKEIISTNPGHEVSFEGNRLEHSPKWPTRVVETAKMMQAQTDYRSIQLVAVDARDTAPVARPIFSATSAASRPAEYRSRARTASPIV